MKAMEMKVETMAAQSEITGAIKAASKGMSAASGAMDMKQIMSTMKEYNKATGELDMKMDMVLYIYIYIYIILHSLDERWHGNGQSRWR